MLWTLSLMAMGGLCFAISVSITPDPVVTQLQQAFTVNVRLDTATQVRGVAIWISHDTSKLNFISASRGSLFTGANVGWWVVNTTDTPGTTRIECIIFGAGLFVTGPGNLLNVNYTPTSGDFASLNITEVRLYEPQAGLVIPGVTSTNGNVIIGSQTAYVRAKCWLQGPYLGAWMKSDLRSVMPLSSPYTEAPASVSAIPDGAVDWMLVELRSSASGSVVARQSVFIHQDGTLRSLSKPFIIFMNIPAGNYFVVLRHRNHLAVMSANAVLLAGSGSPGLIDLTVLDNIYGRGGVIEKEPGVYVLAAGDADQDGGVYPTDRNLYWRVQAGMSGYYSADFSLDGNVFPSDVNLFWRPNSGMATRVPTAAQ